MINIAQLKLSYVYVIIDNSGKPYSKLFLDKQQAEQYAKDLLFKDSTAHPCFINEE